MCSCELCKPERLPDVFEIRRRLHGEGEHFTDQQLLDAWEAFSESYDATWLVVEDHTFGCFCGYLLRRSLK